MSQTTSSHNIPLERAKDAFQRLHGSAPSLAAMAPGRVNLIGEHTDYNDGFVLPIAIDRACVCVAGVSRDAKVSRLHSVDREGLVTVDWDAAASNSAEFVASLSGPESWARYVIGVVELVRRQAAAQGATRLHALDIVIASDVPLGSGLSSSAALEMSVAHVMEQHAGLTLSPLVKARLCQQAEHEFAGVPCGIMDQYASAFGKAGHAILLDCRSLTHEYVPMPPADDTGAVIVVANSNVRHDLASGEYAKRREDCARAAGLMGLASLRDVQPLRAGQRDIITMLPPDLERVVHHVVFDSVRAENFARLATEAGGGKATWKRSLPELGKLMLRSHASLRDYYKVSCPELDTLVELASGVRGVYGARMTGGGFGGCIIALVRPVAVEQLIDTLQAEYPKRHQRSCTCFVVRASAGAQAITV
ncbi:MAG: galactokinase [Pyrinomonadaceae bacterium]|nr:galactokinase [Phycisphaerales bacterium]